MAILNATPDSFYASSRLSSVESIQQRAMDAVRDGATILDVGAYSSRQQAEDIGEELEWERLNMALKAIREVDATVPISIDTFRSGVVERAIERFGSIIVNDITAGEADGRMLAVVSEAEVPYIAMHMRGTPQTMQRMNQYPEGVVSEVVEYFERRVEVMLSAGIAEESIVLDPGFGFAKSVEQCYELLGALPHLSELGSPILVGLSRKSMIYKVLDTTPEEALVGTMALNWEALSGGATVLRVHDVEQAVQCVKLFECYEKYR